MNGRLVVMHRPECELCEEMLVDIERLRATVDLPPVELVDVDSDTELNRKYGLSIPVLLLDGTVVCRHRLDAAELVRLLGQRSA